MEYSSQCCEKPKSTRSEALRRAQQNYRMRNRPLMNERQRLWYSQNKEKHDSYRKKNKIIQDV